MVILRRVLLLAAMAVLAGCSPEYNWRQVSVADGMAQVLMPAKPQSRQEAVPLGGYSVDFTLTTSTVGDATFAVGYAALPPDLISDPDAKSQLSRAIVGSFYQNLNVPPPADLPALDQVFDIQGNPGGTPLRLKAKILWTGKALLEGMVVASTDSFPEQQADEFLATVKAAAGR